ncbi:MAG: flavodoxin family protein [Christensenellales bacterium]
MKKIASLLVTALLLAALAMVGMAEEEQSHVLIAYYSRTGTTQEAAERIAELTGGDLVKLKPFRRTRRITPRRPRLPRLSWKRTPARS